MKRSHLLLSACAMAGLFSAGSPAAILYNDDFNSDTSANYNIYATQTVGNVNSSDATFAFNYGATPYGIPVAPHTTDATTIGLRLRVDDVAASGSFSSSIAVGAISLSPKTVGYTLPSTGGYTLRADIWGNYIGSGTSIASSGSNGTTGSGIGIATAGTALVSPNGGTQGGISAVTLHDNSTPTYRVYNNNGARYDTTTGYYTASLTGTDATAENFSNAYYANAFPANTAPSAQSTASTTQGGSTAKGVTGFAWHTFYLQNDGTNVTWYVDNLLVATVPVTAFTTGGSNISISGFDTGLTGAYATPQTTYNFDVVDNLVLETGIDKVPEPTSLTMLGLATLGALARRRRA